MQPVGLIMQHHFIENKVFLKEKCQGGLFATTVGLSVPFSEEMILGHFEMSFCRGVGADP